MAAAGRAGDNWAATMKPGDKVYDPQTGYYGVVVRSNGERKALLAYLIKLDNGLERWRRHNKITPVNKPTA